MKNIYEKLRWQSDWNGYEVGHDDIEAVGLYTLPDYPIDVFIDCETGKIVEAFYNEEDKDDDYE